MRETCEVLDIACQLSGLIDTLLEMFQFVWGKILSALIAVLNLIPVPEWANNATLSIPASILWVANMFELTYGASVMVSAMTIRFVIRRLPVVG